MQFEKQLELFAATIKTQKNTDPEKKDVAKKISTNPKDKKQVKEFIHVYIDGASRGNPGKAGVGIFGVDHTEKTIFKKGFYLGIRTNNQAEYGALLLAALLVRKHLGSNTNIPITFISDSQLVIRQMSGIYKIKDATLKKFHAAALAILDGTIHSFKHVLREYNTQADALANKGVDAKTKIPLELTNALAKHEITI